MSETAITNSETSIQKRQETGLAGIENLMQIALQNNAVDQFSKLMELYNNQQDRLAKQAYLDAMAEWKEICPVVYKDNHVEYTKKDNTVVSYNHATLGNSLNVLAKDLGKFGFSISWKRVDTENNKIRIECECSHRLGHVEKTWSESGPDPSGNKNDIQAIGSAETYLSRYTFFRLLGIAAVEDDDGKKNLDSYERISKQQESVIDEWIAKFDNKDKLLALCSKKSGFEITKVSDIPALAFDSIIKMYQEKEKNKVE